MLNANSVYKDCAKWKMFCMFFRHILSKCVSSSDSLMLTTKEPLKKDKKEKHVIYCIMFNQLQ